VKEVVGCFVLVALTCAWMREHMVSPTAEYTVLLMLHALSCDAAVLCPSMHRIMLRRFPDLHAPSPS